MSWICNECGAIFDDPKTVRGIDGDGWSECPSCGSEDYEEAKECERCGDVVSESDAYGFDHCVCKSCINDHRHNIRLLMKATENEGYDVSIPALARYILSDAEIEDVLTKELERKLECAKEFDGCFFDTTKFLKDYASEIADEIMEEGE